jgi:hypothetical protein
VVIVSVFLVVHPVGTKEHIPPRTKIASSQTVIERDVLIRLDLETRKSGQVPFLGNYKANPTVMADLVLLKAGGP